MIPYNYTFIIDKPPIPDQVLVFGSKNKLNSVPSTRRSGKTSGLILYSIMFGLQGKEIAIVYPTHDDSKDIFLKIETIASPFIKSQDKAALTIRLIDGGLIRFFSYEAFNRLRGKKFHYVFCDEFQECRIDESQLWATLLPTLADYKGQAFFFGTPKKGTLIHTFSEKKEPEWDHFKMKAVNNPFIDPAEIALQKKILNPLIFAQEWEGEFVDFADDKWLYDFDYKIHLKDEILIDPYSRITLCFDFNVDPGTCIFKQKIDDLAVNGGGINFFKEIKSKGSTQQLCKEVKKYLDLLTFYKGTIWVTGDSSGTKRDTRSNKSDYEIIRNELGIPFARFVDTTKQNPLLGYSRDLCNTAFYNNLITIDRINCPELAKDCSLAKSIGSGDDHLLKDRKLYKLDSFDAMRYGIHSDFRSIQDVLRFARVVNG